MTLAELGRLDEAIAQGLDAVQRAERLDRPPILIQACWCLAYVWSVKGEFARVAPLIERNSRIAEHREVGLMAHPQRWFLGYARARAGQIREALSPLREGVEAWTR